MEKKNEKKTTVALDPETREHLKKFGSKGESYDQILTKVINKANSFCNKSSKNDDVAAKEKSTVTEGIEMEEEE